MRLFAVALLLAGSFADATVAVVEAAPPMPPKPVSLHIGPQALTVGPSGELSDTALPAFAAGSGFPETAATAFNGAVENGRRLVRAEPPTLATRMDTLAPAHRQWPWSAQPMAPNAPIDCRWFEWTPWSNCSVTCGMGVTTRVRTVAIHAERGGKPCEGSPEETAPCEMQGCPSDCRWGQWGEWSPCTVSCGGKGVSERIRAALDAPANGGRACTLAEASETRKCGDFPCAAVGLTGLLSSAIQSFIPSSEVLQLLSPQAVHRHAPQPPGAAEKAEEETAAAMVTDLPLSVDGGDSGP